MAVVGDVDQTSVPLVLEEIRRAAGLIDDVFDRNGTARRLSVDLTETDRLEGPAVEELMALVFELEAGGVTVRIVHGR